MNSKLNTTLNNVDGNKSGAQSTEIEIEKEAVLNDIPNKVNKGFQHK